MNLKIFDKLLLLFEDVFEFSQSGLHLFQREVLFTFCSTICHSLTRVSHLAIHSSETAFTFTYLSLRAATSSSASLWVVILRDACAASSKIFRCLRHPASKALTTANMALAPM